MEKIFKYGSSEFRVFRSGSSIVVDPLNFRGSTSEQFKMIERATADFEREERGEQRAYFGITELRSGVEDTRRKMLDIIEVAKGENRRLTLAEETEFNRLKDLKESQIKDIDKYVTDMENEQRNLRVKGAKLSFSLCNCIRSIIGESNLTEDERRTLEQGRKEFTRAQIVPKGAITLPSERAISVGGGAPVSDISSLALGPLYYASVFESLGVSRIENAWGDMTFPEYTGTAVGWAGETEQAKKGNGEVLSKTFKPHRLTAVCEISKQLLIQDASGLEEVIKRDIFEQVAHKLQTTVFGAKDETNAPKGLFTGVDTVATSKSYADILKIMTDAERSKFGGENAKILLSLEAQAKMMQIGVGTDITHFKFAYDYDNKTVCGTPAVVSGDVVAKGAIIADWRDFVIVHWGGTDILVDPYSKADEGIIRLVVNYYVDAGFRRSDAYKAFYLAQ